ncbi:MAG TPA: hypothetical protein DCZ91_17585 [Lachnospiraceae bacterium]|nr:hypothetical protein [Lachnospiraceae bacterium]
MKIYAVRDEEEKEPRKDLAYLIYYEKEKCFYVELPEDADKWETPLLLSSFAERGIRTVGAYYSMLWVRQRIIPTDRQNLGQILKENGLEEYDEHTFLVLAEGRCAQDSYYLKEIPERELPESFADRYRKRIEDVLPRENGQLLVFFRDDSVRRCDIGALTGGDRRFRAILDRKELFHSVKVSVGGYEVSWGENLTISDFALYDSGKKDCFQADDFVQFAEQCLVNTSGAAEILNCSRQYINELVCEGRLHVVRQDSRNRLFMRSEVMKCRWR